VVPDLVGLLGLGLTTPECEVLAAIVRAAMRATSSPIGFCHYLNPDGRTVEIGACASGTGDPLPVARDRRVPVPATEWGAPVGLGRPVVDNEPRWVADLPGFADHVTPVRRYLGIPVIDRDGGLLLGLANARSLYTDRDTHAAQEIARAGWAVLARGRTFRAAVEDLTLLTDLADVRTGTWRWDPDTGHVTWSEATLRLLNVGYPGEPTWAPLDDRLEPFSRYGLRQARDDLPEGQDLELELWARDCDGRQLKLLLRGRWSQRPHGSGWMVQGTLADVTALEAARRARDRATRDQLTGLTNRAGLIAELTRRFAAGHRRAVDQFAVHLLDLNRFKQVNDTHGHLAGDAVLRATAARLLQCVRRDDLVARLGGDEFVIVQHLATTHAEAHALAARVITAVSQPIDINGATLTIGTSIGVAFTQPDRPSVKDLLSRADDALYTAKRGGGGLHMDTPHQGAAPPTPPAPEPPEPDPSTPRRRRSDPPMTPPTE
jgi:diguanylate cyclase (GGDEF)-like protein